MKHVIHTRALVLATVALLFTPGLVLGQGRPITPGQPIATPEPVTSNDLERPQTRRSTALRWIPLEIPDFPPGALVSVVHGDPNVRNRDFVIRIRFPAGYRFPPSWHEESEHITVLQGSFLFAMGDEADESELQRYGPGDFVFAPAGAAHYGGARVTTVIQVHGTGPFRMNMGASPIR
ncbi:MAG TPA: cupin domain-containing protein [Gemmatimonadaceae bacterium]|nr:cupin domain-containing protein [Gemmatimonadaceae bacterium]